MSGLPKELGDDFEAFLAKGSEEKYTLLKQPIFAPADVKVSHRLLNYWSSIGLLDDNREKKNARGWRKFSITEVAWLYIIRDLREFEVSTPFLLRVKEHLLNPQKRGKRLDIVAAIALGISSQISVFIKCDTDGAEILLDNEYQDSLDSNARPFITIRLNYILSEIFPDLDWDARPELDDEPLIVGGVLPLGMTENEVSALIALKNGTYDDITIKAHNGKVHHIEKVKKYKEAVRVVDLLKDVQFGTVTTQIKKGKVVFTALAEKEDVPHE